MTRRCSHCSNNGHNARTCPARSGGGGGGGGGGVRLFGVHLTSPPVAAMKKSASMSCIASSLGGGSGGSSPAAGPGGERAPGYVSDDPMHASCSINGRAERKKGTPWTEEEHRMFLLGLQKLGKGDWRGISRSFVVSRTPTQVASHAQKYFIRQTNFSRRKRRSSLFDMIPEMPMDESPDGAEEFMLSGTQDEATTSSNRMSLFHLGQQKEAECDKDLPVLQLRQHEESEYAEASLEAPDLEMNNAVSFKPASVPTVPAFYPALIPVPLTLWPANVSNLEVASTSHEVLKPTPVNFKEAIKADEVVSMSKLSIGGGSSGSMEPSALLLQLTGPTNTRQSAFHECLGHLRWRKLKHHRQLCSFGSSIVSTKHPSAQFRLASSELKIIHLSIMRMRIIRQKTFCAKFSNRTANSKLNKAAHTSGSHGKRSPHGGRQSQREMARRGKELALICGSASSVP